MESETLRLSILRFLRTFLLTSGLLLFSKLLSKLIDLDYLDYHIAQKVHKYRDSQ